MPRGTRRRRFVVAAYERTFGHAYRSLWQFRGVGSTGVERAGSPHAASRASTSELVFGAVAPHRRPAPRISDFLLRGRPHKRRPPHDPERTRTQQTATWIPSRGRDAPQTEAAHAKESRLRTELPQQAVAAASGAGVDEPVAARRAAAAAVAGGARDARTRRAQAAAVADGARAHGPAARAAHAALLTGVLFGAVTAGRGAARRRLRRHRLLRLAALLNPPPRARTPQRTVRAFVKFQIL